jgi:hypothetical protein
VARVVVQVIASSEDSTFLFKETATAPSGSGDTTAAEREPSEEETLHHSGLAMEGPISLPIGVQRCSSHRMWINRGSDCIRTEMDPLLCFLIVS